MGFLITTIVVQFVSSSAQLTMELLIAPPMPHPYASPGQALNIICYQYRNIICKAGTYWYTYWYRNMYRYKMTRYTTGQRSASPIIGYRYFVR